MKILLFILFVTIIVYSCTTYNPKSDKKDTQKDFGDYKVKTIDGCEYIEFDDGLVEYRVYGITHKGNCKNPIHTKSYSSQP